MDIQFEKALKILVRTYPFVLLKVGAALLAVFLSAAWFVGIFLLYRDWPFPGPSWLAWVFGGLLFGKGFGLLRNYLLYLIKAAHVSVITRLAVEGELPAGTDQISFGASTLRRHFLRVSVLFAVDQLVKVVLKAFNRSVFRLISFVPGILGLQRFLQRVLDYSLGYVDEAILSFTLTQPGRNPWLSARDGLILYVQNWKTILKSGQFLALISYGVFGLFAFSALLLAYFTAGVQAKIVAAVTLGLGFVVKFALMDPFALTTVIVSYHSAIAGQAVDPSWGKQLEEISGHFREFQNRARQWGTAGSTPPPAPSPP